MPKAEKTRYFDERDLDLLESALELCPDLDVVAYAAKLARNKVAYPIESHAGLAPLFGRDKIVRFKDQELTPKHAERFIPKEFFPISSERDLMCKLMLAFQRGKVFHYREQLMATGGAAGAQGSEEVVHLPSPMPMVIGNLPMGPNR